MLVKAPKYARLTNKVFAWSYYIIRNGTYYTDFDYTMSFYVFLIIYIENLT